MRHYRVRLESGRDLMIQATDDMDAAYIASDRIFLTTGNTTRRHLLNGLNLLPLMS